MIKQINFSDFCDAFRNAGRENSFSYAGKRALFNFLEENFPDMELDIIALDCEFSESEDAVQWLVDNGYKGKLVELTNDNCPDVDTNDPNLEWSELTDDDQETIEMAAREWLHNQTLVIEADGMSGLVIVQGF